MRSWKVVQRFLALAAMLASVWLPLQAAAAQSDGSNEPRPNFVVIVVDDAAFMDFGAYGGEARTPNIDGLARRGAMFLNHHSSPLCSPSRAMLLTGVDSHRTGHATIEEVLPRALRGRPGYSLRLEPGVLTIADRLRMTGYRTLMAGKWHLGRGEGDLPNSHGFDRSLALDASGADNYAQRPYMPYYDHAPWYEDGQPATLPESFYSSDLLVDRLIGYIDEAPVEGAPYFAYLAFQAVHIPVQAPRAFSDNYAGRFDAGWEALRTERWRRAREMGLTPPSAALNPLPDTLRRWSALTGDERRTSARGMEVYAGMLEAMDAAIGRLIARIEARGELERTVFFITSDNGPEPSDPVHAPGMNIWMPLNGYHWDRDRLGEPGSLAYIGPEWAASISSPHSLYKFYASEGGLRVPLIVAGASAVGDARLNTLTYVTDIAPTILELAGAPLASGEERVHISGRSLSSLLRGEADGVRGSDDVVGVEVSGNAALFRGDFKIVRNMPPVGDGRWRLYNLRADPGETRDLSAGEPELLADMLRAYDDYAREAGVLALPEGYRVERQILLNSIGRQLRYHGLALAAVAAVVLALLALAARSLLRLRRSRT